MDEAVLWQVSLVYIRNELVSIQTKTDRCQVLHKTQQIILSLYHVVGVYMYLCILVTFSRNGLISNAILLNIRMQFSLEIS